MAPVHPGKLQHPGAGRANLLTVQVLTSTLFVENSDERMGKDQSYLLDSASMRQVHGWSDQVTLEQGLQETLDWVDANLATLKNLPWNYQHKT